MLKPQRAARLRRYHAAQLTQREMAARFGVTQACVWKWLRELGLKPHAPGGHATPKARANHRAGRKRAWVYQRVREEHELRVRTLIEMANERRGRQC